MRLLKLFRLSALGLMLVAFASILPAHTAANQVSASRIVDSSMAVTAENLKPPECAGLYLENIVNIAAGDLPTERNDLILGTPGSDLLEGRDGNDCILGGGGDDNFIPNKNLKGSLMGGKHNDVILGGPGDDGLFGEHGDDRLYGGDGYDYCDGGAGEDLIYGCEETIH